VLAYSLTQGLRLRDVPHYVIRAYPPDGEGDWFLAGDVEAVRHVRVKGGPGDAWLAPLVADIANRHLPLIVDLGGLPTPAQEALLDACTHAVVLAPDAAARQAWRERFARYGLVLLADLHSSLRGVDGLAATSPVLRGTLAGLERGALAHGPAFIALLDRLTDLFHAAAEGLPRRHLTAAPTELAVDVVALAERLRVPPEAWPPSALPRVLDYLPGGEPLGLYGRGPNWLYAAIARHALPAPFHLFDVRRGWVQAPALTPGVSQPEGALAATLAEREGIVTLTLQPCHAYLEFDAAERLAIPRVEAETLVLSGKLPLWLWAGLARAYAVPRLAVAQPQLGGAVVVRDTLAGQVGTVLPLG